MTYRETTDRLILGLATIIIALTIVWCWSADAGPSEFVSISIAHGLNGTRAIAITADGQVWVSHHPYGKKWERADHLGGAK